MREYTPRQSLKLLLVGSALCGATFLAACGDKAADSSALNTDSALGRDLAMAASDSAAAPKLQDVPAPEPAPVAAPVPVAPRPRPAKPAPAKAPRPVPAAPAPAPAAPTSGVVAVGTTMNFASNQKICSNTTQVGEKFTADLTESVSASSGLSIPAGATGTFEVTDAKTAKNSNDETVLSVRLVSVQYGGRSYPVQATVENASTQKLRSASKSTDVKKVAGGAIIGGILGQVIGKNTKGTVIGAAAGAAAGTAAAAATANYDTCLNNGSTVTVKLDMPVTIRAAAAP